MLLFCQVFDTYSRGGILFSIILGECVSVRMTLHHLLKSSNNSCKNFRNSRFVECSWNQFANMKSLIHRDYFYFNTNVSNIIFKLLHRVEFLNRISFNNGVCSKQIIGQNESKRVINKLKAIHLFFPENSNLIFWFINDFYYSVVIVKQRRDFT